MLTRSALPMTKIDRHSSELLGLADTKAMMGENNMNMTENKLTWAVLFGALGLIALGHIVAGFLLAVCVALFLGSRINDPNSPLRRPFVMPDDGWSITCEEHKIPVFYCASARDNVMRFMAGQSQEVELEQEEETRPSPNVSVYGRWTDKSGYQQRRKLGHISAREVKGLYSETRNRPECRVSAKISEIFIPSKQNAFPGLALDIAVLEPSS
jgi:hypothetical protein